MLQAHSFAYQLHATSNFKWSFWSCQLLVALMGTPPLSLSVGPLSQMALLHIAFHSKWFLNSIHQSCHLNGNSDHHCLQVQSHLSWVHPCGIGCYVASGCTRRTSFMIHQGHQLMMNQNALIAHMWIDTWVHSKFIGSVILHVSHLMDLLS